MATTFKILNGDITVNSSSGRPLLIGNPVGSSDKNQSKLKMSQDMKRSLSLASSSRGDTAGLSDLVGKTIDSGFNAIQLFIDDRIRQMFTNLVRLQKIRSNIRPVDERFSSIDFLHVTTSTTNPSSYQFRLDVSSANNTAVAISGTIG